MRGLRPVVSDSEPIDYDWKQASCETRKSVQIPLVENIADKTGLWAAPECALGRLVGLASSSTKRESAGCVGCVGRC